MLKIGSREEYEAGIVVTDEWYLCVITSLSGPVS